MGTEQMRQSPPTTSTTPRAGEAAAAAATAAGSVRGAAVARGIPWQSGAEIRRKFIEFFAQRGHQHVPSASLVPYNDPTVLLTSAGMQQMIPYFLGLEEPPAVRMTSVQKCFRTVDIDEVGDYNHCTLFLMLGNFSVRDYFKSESLAWSWEFLTDPQWMGIPPELVYPTVHPTDDAAYAIWRDEVGVPEERIVKLEDNWWSAGATGPNGPDSEIYVDRGEHLSCGRPECAPGCDCARYLETWNNVFIEFNTGPDGVRTPLPKPCIDTGMGYERLVLVSQSADSIYDTDLYQPIIQRASELAGVTYGLDPQIDRALRVIADHSRAGAFLIGDGVLPGNEGRSYVLRRVLRRAVRHGRLIGLDGPFLGEMARIVVDQFGEHYPELADRQSQIMRVLAYEEESFGRTLAAGMNRLQALTTELKARGERVLPGDDVFRLYDTYGFPYDLTVELAHEEEMEVDVDAFELAMAAQREASRSVDAFKDASRDRAALYAGVKPRTQFLGYEEERAEATVVALLGPDGRLEQAEAGQEIELVLDWTPFYGESGGQVGDSGEIRTDTGVLNVDDTRRPAPDLFVHRGIVSEGFLSAGDTATATIDAVRRQEIRRNHTATHLLHRALRIVLGTDTRQAGSLVAPDRLRFDFTAIDPVRPEQLAEVVAIVNREVTADRPVTTDVRPYKDAVAGGAMALFGEKYGDSVRVVGIDDFSQELCGGTHVAHTGQIGPFVVASEGSVAAGVRRIEALTGEPAVERILGQGRVLEELGRGLKVSWTEVPAQVQALQERARTQEREIARLRGQLAGARTGDLLDGAEEIGGVKVLAVRVEAETTQSLRQLGDRLRDSVQSGVIVLGAAVNGRASLLAMVTPDVVTRGARAGDIVREAAAHIEGRGGGRPELAEAGGKNPAGLDAALASAREVVARQLGG